jgi:hypothetical protein
MPKTKISEFSSTPANNTDIDSINISEGCAPSGINDAIRELMAQLKDFQTGAVGDSFNGPIGSTTASTGAFTTLTTTGTINNLTVGRGAGAVSTNTAVGANALTTNSSGSGQTAIGYNALRSETTATNNTVVGTNAGYSTTTGSDLAAVGQGALFTNTTGDQNTAIGAGSLFSNTTASNNTAVGYQAGYSNQTGARSVLVGGGAGYTATALDGDTHIGFSAGNAQTTGFANTFVGSRSLSGSNQGAGNSLTTGIYNTFIGGSAGSAITTGSRNTILGNYSGNTGSLDIRTSDNNVVFSDGAGNIVSYFNSSNAYIVRIGTGAGSNAVKINTTTKELTYDTSSARYKDNIRDSVYGLDAVMALRSAMFEYKKEQRTDVGLIAEEVDLVIPELVGKNSEGQPDSVSYDRMVSVLVKAIQELKEEFDAYKASHP